MFRNVQRTLALVLPCAAAMVAWPAGGAHAGTQSVDGTWSALPGNVFAPSARREHAAIYDAQHDRYLMFGGFGFSSPAPENNFNEVWALTMTDPPTWTQLNVQGTPPGPRKDVQWGYDVARNRLLIFGGYGQHYADTSSVVNWLNDVWELSLDGTPTWTELFPQGTPPSGRLAGVAVYDPLRQRFVGFGGTAGAPVDTWSLELAHEPVWTTIPTGSQRPNGSYGMGSIYDPLRDRMVTFGGSLGDQYYGAQNSVWELTLGGDTQWNELIAGTDSTGTDSTGGATASAPAPRRTMAAVYDPLRDRMLIFGGFDAISNSLTSFLNDTWALSLPDLTWRHLAPDGSPPTGRDATAAIYDPTRDRLVLYGGWSGDTMLGDTEYLTWGVTPTAATVTGSASVSSGSAALQWNVSQATGTHAAVYRSSATEPWTSLAAVDADANGHVAYVDPTVTAGGQYAYELVVASQQGESVGGRVAVTIPGTTGAPKPAAMLALDPVRPNPLVDHFRVSFTLPDAAPARLEVVDVGGRRVSAQDVGALGPGPHALDLGAARALAPGLYFVRLAHGGRTLTTRAVVVGR